MENIWVCKADGTVQCDDNAKEISLEDMKALLAVIIGMSNILNMEKRSLQKFTLCGAPTGKVNAYEITQAGWDILNRGFVGSAGFRRCPDEMHGLDAGETGLGQFIAEMANRNPTDIQNLVGHTVRVYETGAPITMDWRPDRFNVVTNKNGIIVRVWFG